MRPGLGLLLLLAGSAVFGESLLAVGVVPQDKGFALFLMMAGLGLFLERGEPNRL